MIKKFSTVVLAMMLLLSSSIATVQGGHGYLGYFNTPSIDTNLNGNFDLNVCLGAGVGDPIYDNRAVLLDWARNWHQATVGENNAGTGHINGFASNGKCDAGDTANIKVSWNNLGVCSYLGGTGSWTVPPPDWNGYSTITIQFNNTCLVNGLYDWQPPIDAGKLSAPGLFLHEVGHALGLAHDPWSGPGNDVMNEGGPDNCNSFWGNGATISGDDAWHARNRYPGIVDTFNVFPGDATCWD